MRILHCIEQKLHLAINSQLLVSSTIHQLAPHPTITTTTLFYLLLNPGFFGPYALRPCVFLPPFIPAPSVTSTLGGVLNPNAFATFTKSNLLTSNTLLNPWLAYA